jgi:hypothetical protein
MDRFEKADLKSVQELLSGRDKVSRLRFPFQVIQNMLRERFIRLRQRLDPS